jgi:hypothetical protein
MAHAFGNGYVEQARRRGVREDAHTPPKDPPYWMIVSHSACVVSNNR